jgi:hypothetical protein
MQSQKKQKAIPLPGKLLVFPASMSTPSLPPEDPQGWNPQRHGNLAQWIAPIITLIIGIVTVGMMMHYRNVDSAGKTADEHLDSRIDAKLNPAKESINMHIDSKIDPLNTKIDGLSERVSRIEGSLGNRVSKLETKTDQQTSLAKVLDPNVVLATVRMGLQTAASGNKQLPKAELVDYRNVVQAMPSSAYEYWTTVAAIINYQSKLNQMSGEAPDPRRVSKNCGAFTLNPAIKSDHVTVSRQRLSNCIVDLDIPGMTYMNVVVSDSVVRYSGGPVQLINVTFINCYFDLNIKSPPSPPPSNGDLLIALLESPDQKSVIVR